MTGIPQDEAGDGLIDGDAGQDGVLATALKCGVNEKLRLRLGNYVGEIEKRATWRRPALNYFLKRASKALRTSSLETGLLAPAGTFKFGSK